MMRRCLEIAAIVVALAGCAASTRPQPTGSPAGGSASTAQARPPDTIVITGNTSNDNAVLLVDGRRNNCVNDEVWRGSGTVAVGNLRRPRSCNSEIVVFTNHSAMQLNETVVSWTDSSGDRVQLPSLAAPVSAPVFVWVVQAPFQTTQAQALTDVARGNMLYGMMNCGIQFTVTTRDATADPQAPSNLVRRCDQASTLRTEIGFMPGQVNAYYIAEAQNQLGQPGRGAWCGSPVLVPSPTEDDKNTILISTGLADNETLAHEVGHALSLGHTNTFPTIPTTNLLSSGGLNRNSLTEGQCFRCNVNIESAVNRLHVRVGPTRSCPDSTSIAKCPPLSLDVNPNN
jgi:hypothetical protein